MYFVYLLNILLEISGTDFLEKYVLIMFVLKKEMRKNSNAIDIKLFKKVKISTLNVLDTSRFNRRVMRKAFQRLEPEMPE